MRLYPFYETGGRISDQNDIIDKFVKKKSLSDLLRIFIPLYGTYVIFALSVFLIFIPNQEKQLTDQKKETSLQLTDNVLSLLADYDSRVREGKISPESARREAANQIRHLRYGNEGKDYFWINDMHPYMIMHPYRSDLERKDLTPFRDKAGTPLFVEMVDIVKKQKGGYVNYFWQWKDTPEKIVPKISYVKGFEPWGWIIGTGIYVDDIRNEIQLITVKFIKIFSGILIFIVLLSFYIANQIVKMHRMRDAAEKARLFEALRLKKLFELSQMSQKSLKELTEFALEEAIELTESQIGFLAFLNEDETQLTMHTWSRQTMKQCDIQDKILIYNVEETGLWAEAARTGKSFVVNDYEAFQSPRKKGYPSGHVPIRRVINVPIFDKGKMVALAGVGNKDTDYDASDEQQLRLMMDGMLKILHRKRAEDNLRESEKRYRLLAENASDGIWTVRLSDYRFSYVSPSMEKITGYPVEALAGMEMGTHMTERSRKEVAQIIAEERARDLEENVDPDRHLTLEIEMFKKDHTRLWAEVTARFLRDETGRADRILGITRDITERKNLEVRIQQAQKMEALGTLAGGIAHDFNNILSSIIGFTELSRLKAGSNEELKKHLDRIMAAGLRARDLVKHILTFSRKADTQKMDIKLLPLIKECLQFLKASVPPNIEIHRNFLSPECRIHADPTQLHQVFMNLFTNAAHAMKENGGILEVTVKSVEILKEDLLQSTGVKPGKYVQISVSDTGTGIPEHLVKKVFEPFFTTKARGEGTGMGLALVYGIIEEMHGTISVYSETGAGTTFRLLMPELETALEEKTRMENSQLARGSGRILLVDDEPSIVEWTALMLQQIGYDVFGYTSPREALNTFEDNASGFDLVLTDLAMPEISGLDLAQKIKEKRPDIPILICTGFSEGLTRKTTTSYGIRGIIMKPIIASELADAVGNAMKTEVGHFSE